MENCCNLRMSSNFGTLVLVNIITTSYTTKWRQIQFTQVGTSMRRSPLMMSTMTNMCHYASGSRQQLQTFSLPLYRIYSQRHLCIVTNGTLPWLICLVALAISTKRVCRKILALECIEHQGYIAQDCLYVSKSQQVCDGVHWEATN